MGEAVSWDFDNKHALAVRLKALRQAKGLSQQEVAERADIGVKSLSSWETGMRIHSIKLGQLRRVLLVYGIGFREFFSESPETALGCPRIDELA